jgi:hypothetical protein
MTGTGKQLNKVWLIALAPMIGFTSFVMMSLPAQADLTCYNIREAKNLAKRECRGLKQLQDKFMRRREYLNNRFGSKSAAPQDIVDDYYQEKHHLYSRRSSCKTAVDTHNILIQMAREQGLSCGPKKPVSGGQGYSQSNGNSNSSQNQNAMYNNRGKNPSCFKQNPDTSKTFRRIDFNGIPNDGTHMDCTYHKNGNLIHEYIVIKGKSARTRRWYPDGTKESYTKFANDGGRKTYNYDKKGTVVSCTIGYKNGAYNTYGKDSKDFSKKCT